MNDLVKAPRSLPRLSPDLICALGNQVSNRFGPSDDGKRRAGDPTPGMILNIRTPTPSRKIVREAQNALEGYKALLAPTDPEMLRKNLWWLLAGINGAIRNPMGEAATDLRVSLLAKTVSNFPSGAWDDDMLTDALRRFDFMPSVAELTAYLDTKAAVLRAKVARIETIAGWSFKEPEAREKPTAEEVERRQAAVADLEREARERDREDQEIRDFGMWMPAGSEGATGPKLAEILRSHLQELDGPKLRITQERIEKLERNAAIAAQLEGMKP